MGEINTHPTVCNICGGKVVYCSNERIYGRKYGSGFCYLCTNCGAYVGTHRPSPHTALGLLADAPMREGKKLCHDLFDKLWKGPKNQGARRTLMYAHLANLMEVSIEDCHFGYFDICQLRQAYRILLRIEKMTDLLENHIPYEQICEKGQFATVKIGKKLTLRVICTKPKRNMNLCCTMKKQKDASQSAPMRFGMPRKSMYVWVNETLQSKLSRASKDS